MQQRSRRGKRFGPLSLNLTPVCVVMKKLVVALISLFAVAFAAGSGFAAEKPATSAPVKAEAQVKPASASKATPAATDASKKPDAGKLPAASKKPDATAPAAGAQAGAVTQDKPATTRPAAGTMQPPLTPSRASPRNTPMRSATLSTMRAPSIAVTTAGITSATTLTGTPRSGTSIDMCEETCAWRCRSAQVRQGFQERR